MHILRAICQQYEKRQRQKRAWPSDGAQTCLPWCQWTYAEESNARSYSIDIIWSSTHQQDRTKLPFIKRTFQNSHFCSSAEQNSPIWSLACKPELAILSECSPLPWEGPDPYFPFTAIPFSPRLTVRLMAGSAMYVLCTPKWIFRCRVKQDVGGMQAPAAVCINCWLSWSTLTLVRTTGFNII